MNKRNLILVLLACALVLSACARGNQSYGSRAATLRDTLFSVEQLNDGMVQVWFTHDDVAVYCTMDVTIGNKLLSLLKEHNGEVLVEYRDLREGDPEWNGGLNGTSCGQFYSDTMELKLISVMPVNGR